MGFVGPAALPTPSRRASGRRRRLALLGRATRARARSALGTASASSACARCLAPRTPRRAASERPLRAAEDFDHPHSAGHPLGPSTGATRGAGPDLARRRARALAARRAARGGDARRALRRRRARPHAHLRRRTADAALRCAGGPRGARRRRADARVSWQLPTRLEALVLAARSRGSAPCRTRCCRSCASARSASSCARLGARLLIVPARLPRLRPRGDGARARGRSSPASPCTCADGALPDGDPGGAPAGAGVRRRRTPRALGLLQLRHDRRPQGRPTHGRVGGAARGARSSSGSRCAPTTGTRSSSRSPTSAASPGSSRAPRRLRARSSSRRSTRRRRPRARRHGATVLGAGTVFHQAYLAAQRERGGAPTVPARARLPGRRRAEAAAASTPR